MFCETYILSICKAAGKLKGKHPSGVCDGYLEWCLEWIFSDKASLKHLLKAAYEL